MVKRNTIPARIDMDLKDEIDLFARKNDLSFIQASKDVAKLMKEAKMNNKKINRIIKF